VEKENKIETALKTKANKVSRMLEQAFGHPTRRGPADPLDELILTVLSQHTSDANSHRAFAALKAAYPSWADAANAPTQEIANAIRSAGLADQKAPRIQSILQAVFTKEGDYSLNGLAKLPTAQAREFLLSLPGVGPKTAACVLLFSLGRPVMPVDTHVHRVAARLGLIPEGTTAERAHDILQQLFRSEDIFSAHLNMIKLGRTLCRPRNPKCHQCPLLSECPYGRSQANAVPLHED
jgi:endonuclease-3